MTRYWILVSGYWIGEGFSFYQASGIQHLSNKSNQFENNTINGYVNGKYLFQLAPVYEISWFYDPRFIIGALFFLSGMIINLHSDHILRILRKNPEDGYRIPQRGFYKYISCPNYFGEILDILD